jgi:hypothetical protein
MAALLDTILAHEASPIVELPSFPTLLPLAHLCDSREFAGHVESFGIAPEPCDFMKEPLVYLYYGGLFFRRSNKPEKRAAMYPVGFLFAGGSLKDVDVCYPFDTGALAYDFYGNAENINSNWRDCEVRLDGDTSAPARLVQYLFGSNRRYLKGQVSSTCSVLPDPFPWLIRFLRSVNTLQGSDQRQYRIECISKTMVPLSNLIWVGYPDSFTDAFARLFQARSATEGSEPPERWTYDTYAAARPAEMAAVLQQAALGFLRGKIDSSV